MYHARSGKAPPLTLALVAALLSLGCDGNPEVTFPDADAFSVSLKLGNVLTSNVTNQLGADGLFALNDPAPGLQAITRQQAVDMAMTLVTQYGQYMIDGLERQHGGPINLASLRPIGRAFLANSPYSDLPTNLPNPIRKNWGPYYLITLAQGNEPAVKVAVSAFAYDMAIQGGRITYVGDEGVNGNEFRWAGIPRSHQWGAIVSPEQAAEIASLETGALVATSPRFFRRGSKFAPYLGYWKVTLDREVQAETILGRESLSVSEVFVDREGRVGVSVPDGSLSATSVLVPGEQRIESQSFRVGRDGDVITASFTRMSELPVAVAEATFKGNGGAR